MRTLPHRIGSKGQPLAGSRGRAAGLLPYGPPTPRHQRGFALLVVLWALVLISLLVLRLTAAGSGEARLGANLRTSAVAEADADGAFAEACARLMAKGGWSLAGGHHELPVAEGRASVTVTNEAGKIDINNASAVLVASLLEGFGESSEAASSLAQSIVAWHTSMGPAQSGPAWAAYRRAGLAYGPPGEPFQSVDELALVQGMTPALLDRLRPHVTVFGLGDPVLALADPVVRRAAAGAGEVETGAGTPADLDGDDVVSLAVTIHAAGAIFTRRGIVQLEPGVAPAPYRVLTWTQASD